MVRQFSITSGAVVVNSQNQILLKKDPKRGWELPGGLVETNETIKETVIREVKEETGINIELLKFCGVSQEVEKGICNMWWIGTPISGEFQTGLESLEVSFFDIDDALQLIKNEDFKQELLHCLNEKAEPFFIYFQ
ncbi:ADP-ribose pyrophosphatase [Solibacillus sp. R5-41]|uniref:NUDIX hydrolase n=1 Tax=Solibacillus sp. R5-41 TaxID=2048654 RepID=UPI000C1282A6|nr:NUDIX hydrolase [Solibacillus sp. R5-41]ATP39711.1 ADP-ribose pyrophosphatase [Solibacillus sp. R5-41]